MWEYTILEFDTGGQWGGKIHKETVEAELNEHGREGWEVVSSCTTSSAYGKSRVLLFTLKRRLES